MALDPQLREQLLKAFMDPGAVRQNHHWHPHAFLPDRAGPHHGQLDHERKQPHVLSDDVPTGRQE